MIAALALGAVGCDDTNESASRDRDGDGIFDSKDADDDKDGVDDADDDDDKDDVDDDGVDDADKDDDVDDDGEDDAQDADNDNDGTPEADEADDGVEMAGSQASRRRAAATAVSSRSVRHHRSDRKESASRPHRPACALVGALSAGSAS